MTSFVPPTSLRPILSGTRAGAMASAGLALTVTALPTAAVAQTAPSQGTGTVTLAPVAVDALALPDESNVNAASTKSNRLPETVKETPRVINVVPAEIIQQQRAITLEQALRNVPGITMSSGEGQGGPSGDQFRIRGLSAKGDIYLDGLKDFGVYTHDTFNTESVEVLKGPSGGAFGVGNSGGLINQSTKQASLQNQGKIEQSFGSGPTYRTAADINHKLSDTVAIRVNAMYQKQDVADRDEVESNRKGVAVDFGMGLGTATTWHLNYSYLDGDKIPDYGVSMIRGSNGILRPATEFGLDNSTSYVRNLDKDDTENHVLTSLLTHDVSSGISLYNDTRWSLYKRDFAATNPGALTAANNALFLNGGNPALAYGAGGGMAYKQDGWAIQNVAGAKLDGKLAGSRNKANVGLDVNYQEDSRKQGTWVNRVNNQTVINPSHSYSSNTYILYNQDGYRASSMENVAGFVNDRLWMTDELSLQGGARLDYFRSAYRTAASSTGGGKETDTTLSPSASLIYEPSQTINTYLSYSRSYKPIGTDIAAAPNVSSTTGELPGNRDFDPEKSDLYELGAKADFLNGRLGLTGAVFLIDKANTYAIDPTTGTISDGFSEAGVGTETRGFELGTSGKITPSWSVFANYAFLSGKVTDSKTTPTIIGNDAANISKHNANLWTTYTLDEAVMKQIPGVITFGGGMQYASRYWADSANTAQIPYTFSLDAMVSYQYEHLSLALNGYNLTNHTNYSSAFNATRAVPASGSTFMLTAGVQF